MATLDEARAAKAAARRWPGAAVGVCPDGAGGRVTDARPRGCIVGGGRPMTVSEMIEELRGMPQGAEFVLNVAWRDADCVTVHEATWAGFSVWHNRGHGGVAPRVEASVTEDLGRGSGIPGCPKCEETARRLRELAG